MNNSLTSNVLSTFGRLPRAWDMLGTCTMAVLCSFPFRIASHASTGKLGIPRQLCYPLKKLCLSHGSPRLISHSAGRRWRPSFGNVTYQILRTTSATPSSCSSGSSRIWPTASGLPENVSNCPQESLLFGRPRKLFAQHSGQASSSRL